MVSNIFDAALNTATPWESFLCCYPNSLSLPNFGGNVLVFWCGIIHAFSSS